MTIIYILELHIAFIMQIFIFFFFRSKQCRINVTLCNSSIINLPTELIIIINYN